MHLPSRIRRAAPLALAALFVAGLVSARPAPHAARVDAAPPLDVASPTAPLTAAATALPVVPDSGSPASTAGEPATPPVPAAATVTWPAWCPRSPDYRARADELLRDVYRIGAFPPVTLPHDLSWREDPFRNPNWSFRLHSLPFVADLLAAWKDSGDARYRGRAMELAADWVRDNPRRDAASPWAYNDHSTALRAVTLACIRDVGLEPSWLAATLDRHGRILADPDFYRREGNHALNQSIALLELGRVTDREDWTDLAAARIDALVVASVDSQGVTNEQSVGYQAFNRHRYLHARGRLEATGRTPSPAFARIERMARFLVHATLPNGRQEMLGDTDDAPALSVPGTANEYASTAGRSGPKPTETVAVYRAGFLFARTGWGERRTPKDETFLSLRFGPAPRFHGHADGGSITMYGFGSRLLVDPGTWGYDGSKWRAFTKGRSGHNVVTVDGSSWTPSPTTLLAHRASSTMVHARVRLTGHSGVAHTRSVTFSRRLGYVVVDDRLASSTARTYRQLWHLVEGADPLVTSGGWYTRRERGNLVVRQLLGGSSTVIAGRTKPVQGWISYHQGTRVAAPVVVTTKRGTSARYITLLVPGARRPSVRVSSLRTTASGYSFVVTINGRSERVVVSATGASIAPVG